MERIEVKGMRKIIAERMSESWHVSPRVVYTLSVNMSKTIEILNTLNKDIQDKLSKVTLNHILMKINADAMKEYTYINSSFIDENIIIHDQVNIGLAVAVDNGLVVPNVKNVGNKDIRTIANEANDVVDRTRRNKITMDDISGGTFTISNLGMMGIESFSPIINQPEVAILGVNKIIQKPVYVDGAFVPKPMMNLNFVADHRVIDGAYAAKYISSVKEKLETFEGWDTLMV